MATPAQIAANQANALKSTGPKSEEGKQSAKMNAVTHGIFTTLPIAQNESQDEFNSILQDFIDLYQPADCHEKILVEKIVMAIWKQKRVAIAEAARINLANLDNQMMLEVNQILKTPVFNPLEINQITGDLSSEYQSCLILEKELKNIDFETKSRFPSTIKNDAPIAYERLHYYANKYKLSWDKFINNPHNVQSALEEMQTAVIGSIELLDLRVKAKKAAALVKQANLIIDEKHSNLLMKYEVRAENAYIRAVDALKKHRESRMKVVESEPMNQ
jgi:hypothetical protein